MSWAFVPFTTSTVTSVGGLLPLGWLLALNCSSTQTSIIYKRNERVVFKPQFALCWILRDNMAVYRLLANSDGNGWENTVYSAILKGSFYKICEETGRAERKTIYTRKRFFQIKLKYKYRIVNVVMNNESKSKSVHCENTIWLAFD